jgi:hypothetical protein
MEAPLSWALELTSTAHALTTATTDGGDFFVFPGLATLVLLR